MEYRDSLSRSFSGHEASAPHHESPAAFAIMAAATITGLLGIAAAYYMYVLNPALPGRLAQQWRSLYELSLHKWYVDELYDRLFVQPTFSFAQALWSRIDVQVIDAAVNGVARAIAWTGWLLRLIQSGQTQHYALGMALGTVLMLTMYLLL